MRKFGDKNGIPKLLKKERKNILTDVVNLPNDEKIANLASVLKEQFEKEKTKKDYASVKLVLTLLGMGSLLVMNMVAPGTAKLWKVIDEEKQRKEKEEWKKYNPYYLRRTIRRLEKQKMVEIIRGKNGDEVVKITSNGKKKILRYSLDNLKIPPSKNWDKKWRVVIWDIPCYSSYLRDIFRKSLEKIGFLKIQKSTYIYPYPCFDEISFLREFYAVGEDVVYLVAEKIENDLPYREYFGLVS